MLNQPFFQITLPLAATFVTTVWAAQWSQNKRLDDIIKRLGKIEDELEKLKERMRELELGRWR